MPFLTTKLLAVAAAVVIAGVGGWGVKNFIQLKSNQAELGRVQVALEQSQLSLERALSVNVSNQATIEELQREKLAIESSIKALQDDRRRNQQVISSLSAAIKAQAADPANQVTLSPVLKSTIESIQKQRLEREGGSK